MDVGSMLYNSLKDVTWSSTTLPLDRLVSAYRLPQIVKLDGGESVEGLRENDYLLIHSCRQWTTITAHSLEEGHYVIGPKIEIPVHYEGQFKLLEQDRDIKEPVQYFNSVEEVAKAFPERVYVMEEITFNVKMASGECNEDTEVYNITLSTGDELTLMGQAEILYAKTSREKSRFNTIFKRIGKLNSIGKLGRGKMPCLICMNHRTNESISLPFQCRGRFSTCSPLELQMQDGEHTIRTIVEKTRLPVNVTVPSSPPRNPHDLHLIREGHRYKLVNIQTKTVVVCCVLRSNKVLPVHFPLHVSTALPRLLVPEGLLHGEAWLETVVHRWFTYCQEQFDIDDYSRAVRDVRVDWLEDGKSPKKSGTGGTGSGTGGGNNSSGNIGTNGCPSHVHLPSSLSSARDELTQSFHRLSVCVYGSNLHGNSEVNLQGCVSLYGEYVPPEPPDADYLFPELLDTTSGPGSLYKHDLPYEELWLDAKNRGPVHELTEVVRTNASISNCSSALPYPSVGSSSALLSTEINLPPPPVPPKSEAVKEECRLLNAPPIPPRSSKQMGTSSTSSTGATLPFPPTKPRQTDTRSPSPTLSYYSSGLHNIGGERESESSKEADDQNHVCYPCNWIRPDAKESTKLHPCLSPSMDAALSRLSWPNNFCGAELHKAEDFASVHCRSYSSYPRKRTPGTPKACSSGLFDFNKGERSEGSAAATKAQQSAQFCTKSTSYTLEMYRDKPIEECNTKQSQSCPILPPRTPKSCDAKKHKECPSTTITSVDTTELQVVSCLPETPQEEATGLHWQPPNNLAGLSIEEVSKSLRFIGMSEDVVALFVNEKIDGNLLLQLTEEILSEDFKLSKLQVKKLMQFISGWRPKM